MEFSENINISLSSEDPEVRFVRDTAEVFIIDATSKFCRYYSTPMCRLHCIELQRWT